MHTSPERIFARDGNRCQYCGSTKRLTLDHVHPRAKGGGDNPRNLITSCYLCNQSKGCQPLSADMMRRIAPQLNKPLPPPKPDTRDDGWVQPWEADTL
jgi:5-methylcytosine-specific restriction endonuclease McrA